MFDQQAKEDSVTREKYEYKDVHFTYDTTLCDCYSEPALIEELNRLGALGWILSSNLRYLNDGDGTQTCSFLMMRKD